MRINANMSDYFLELLRCALHGKPARPKPQEVSWNELFAYAKAQSLATMAYSAIQASGFDVGEELAREWSARCSLNLVKYFNQEHACEALCRTFSEAGIQHMPLKGSVIRDLFPAPEMREMCDLDILVRPEDVERAHAVMLESGYSFMEEHTTSHDRDYQKLPYLNVEIHSYLVPKESKMFPYYEHFWDHTALEDNSLTCRMGWDDCYIFMMAHAYKHFLNGTGIRSVLDVYLMRDKLKDQFDREHICAELKTLGILDFAVRFERLADCWFAEEKTEIPEDLQFYHSRVLESSTYGDNSVLKAKAMQYIVEGKSLRYAKRKVAISKVFPPYSNMKEKYPCLKYLPFLLPLFWVIRWISSIIVNPKKTRAFFKNLRHLKLTGYKEERR